MKILFSQETKEASYKKYLTSAKMACNYINWLGRDFPLKNESIKKGKYYACNDKFSVYYDFTKKLLTVTMKK